MSEEFLIKQKYKNIPFGWQEVLEKLSCDFDNSLCNYLFCGEYHMPSFVVQSSYYPDKMKSFYEKVSKIEGTDDLQIFISLGKNSCNYGKHSDTTNVLLLQVLGNMVYQTDSHVHSLEPGDCLFIPKNVYHTPIINQPRVTFSFSY